MVRIAVAGGSGMVALEIIDALLATKKHDILILSRQDNPPSNTAGPWDSVTWVKADYQDPKQLAGALKGVHTVLSFIVAHLDDGSMSQKNLIDAAVSAGVKRFAPSEWLGAKFDDLNFFDNKQVIRDHLQALNNPRKVLEYCLFQPGLFTDYFAHPHRAPGAKYFWTFEMLISFERRRALVLDCENGGLQGRLTLTTLKDLAEVVCRAVEYEGVWPVVGGIKGTEVTVGELIEIGERVRGGIPFEIERVDAKLLAEGKTRPSWLPFANHPGMPEADEMAPQLTASMLLGTEAGSLNVGDEWNQALGGVELEQAEEFLRGIWEGRE